MDRLNLPRDPAPWVEVAPEPSRDRGPFHARRAVVVPASRLSCIVHAPARETRSPMATKTKDAEIVALAEAMLRELESLRGQGTDAYPPKLRHLGSVGGATFSDEQLRKAAAKKVF